MHTPKPLIYLVTQRDSILVTENTQFLSKFAKYNFDTGLAKQSDTPENADIVLLFQSWSFKTAAYTKSLRKDSFVRAYSERLYVVNYDSNVAEGFLPGCYVSLQKSSYDKTRFKSCAYPKTYNEYLSAPPGNHQVKYLFSFRGTLHSHSIRTKMFSLLNGAHKSLMVDNTKAFHTHTDDEKQTYIKELSESLFVLCPRGSSPNSYRLFEAMSLGRCPVIISDEWVETDGPDWSQCSIRIPEDDIESIVDILSARENEGECLGMNARQEWETHFSERATYQAYLRQLIELASASPPVCKTFEQNLSYWRSHTFLAMNNWAFRQRFIRKFKKLLKLTAFGS